MDEHNVNRFHREYKRASFDHNEKGQPLDHVNLNANLDARIRNPLAGIPYHSLLANVDKFAEEKGLQGIIPYLRKGALVAQAPDDYEDMYARPLVDQTKY